MGSAVVERHRREWEDLAERDPLWAILSYRRHKFGRWDRDEFLATGASEVARLAERCSSLGRPLGRESALDFGCGVGRLAGGLSEAFGRYVGLDISASMVDQARTLHADRPNVSFAVSADESLSGLDERSFDLVYSLHVLQHVDSAATILDYLAGLLRVLREGGLWVVQLPERIPAAEQLVYDTRRALYGRLSGLGLPSHLLYRRLGLFPMTMNFVPEHRVMRLVHRAGARVLAVERKRVGIAIRDRTYYVTR